MYKIDNYSIDMIRVKKLIKIDDFVQVFSKFLYVTTRGTEEHDFLLKEVFLSNIKYYYSTKFQGYKYNFIFTIDNNSFYVGFVHNSEGIGQKHYIAIEYNPNKISENENFICDILPLFKSHSELESLQTWITSIDVCLDIPNVHIDNLIIFKNRFRLQRIFVEDIGKTIYLGDIKSTQFRIYNKKVELKKKSNIDLPNELTRIEVTHKIKKVHLLDLKDYIVTISPVDIFCPRELSLLDNIDIIDIIVLRALMDDITYLNAFTVYQKRKYKSLLTNMGKIEFDSKYVKSLLLMYRNTLLN